MFLILPQKLYSKWFIWCLLFSLVLFHHCDKPLKPHTCTRWKTRIQTHSHIIQCPCVLPPVYVYVYTCIYSCMYVYTHVQMHTLLHTSVSKQKLIHSLTVSPSLSVSCENIRHICMYTCTCIRLCFYMSWRSWNHMCLDLACMCA